MSEDLSGKLRFTSDEGESIDPNSPVEIKRHISMEQLRETFGLMESGDNKQQKGKDSEMKRAEAVMEKVERFDGEALRKREANTS